MHNFVLIKIRRKLSCKKHKRLLGNHTSSNKRALKKQLILNKNKYSCPQKLRLILRVTLHLVNGASLHKVQGFTAALLNYAMLYMLYLSAILYLLCFICYYLSAMLYLLCLICYALSAMLYLLCFICYALSVMLYLLYFFMLFM